MKIFLCKTYDGIEAYLKSNTFVAQRLGVERLPGHSVIARGMAKMPTSYIRLISRLVTLQMRRRGVDVAVDSSGFSLKTSSKWFDIRIKRKSTKRDYIKLHIVIDVDTGIILNFTITDWKGSDAKEFKRLIRDLPAFARLPAIKHIPLALTARRWLTRGKAFPLFQGKRYGEGIPSMANIIRGVFKQ